MKRVFLSAFLLLSWLAPAIGADDNRQAGDEAAVRKASQSYQEAFNRGDADALAALWSPSAVYTNHFTGEEVTGREAIKKQFASVFADNKGAKLETRTDSVQFVSPNVAVEYGTAKLAVPDQETEETEYTAVYVRNGEQWLLDRVTEDDIQIVPTHYDQLKDLEWMVGRWEDADDDAVVTSECSWSKNNNFLIRFFTVNIRGEIDMSGLQIIGWDPSEKKIRSWVFDSDGGFAQGVWKKKGEKWLVHQNGILPDGKKSSAVNIVTRVDENTCTLQSIDRTVDGELLPNVEEVKISRQRMLEE